MVVHALNPGAGEAEANESLEIEASQIYIAGSRPAWAPGTPCCRKTKKKKKKIWEN